MADGSSQYKSSSEQERIVRQIGRDLERPSARDEISGGGLSKSRLSQSTKRALDDPETRDWVRSIINQKASQLGSNNFSSDRTTTRVSQTSRENSVLSDDIQQTSISSSASGGGEEGATEEEEEGGAGLPEGALGDLLYNNGTDWVVLSPPETAEDQEKFFYWNGTDWRFADVKVFDVCENGQAKQYRIPAIPEEE